MQIPLSAKLWFPPVGGIFGAGGTPLGKCRTPFRLIKINWGFCFIKAPEFNAWAGGGYTELWCLVGIWGPHTRQHSWAPGCFATLVVCSLVMCFFKTRQSATSNQEHRKKDKLRSKESRKIGKSAQKRADEQRGISGHLNANRHGRHVAEIWGYLREKITSGFTIKITVHPIKGVRVRLFTPFFVDSSGSRRPTPSVAMRLAAGSIISFGSLLAWREVLCIRGRRIKSARLLLRAQN